jgi:shikimate kinase
MVPHNIILVGFMGTGKTVVGRRLAQRLGWRFIDVDAEIEARSGIPIAEIFAQKGEVHFRELERTVIRSLIHQERQVIATGGGAYVAAENRDLLNARGWVVCLTARPEVIYDRVKHRLAKRPLLAAAEDPLERIRRLCAERESAYAQAHACIDASAMSVEEELEAVWGTLPAALRGA